MKRKVFSIIGMAAVGAAVACNVNSSFGYDTELNVSLADIEVLAQESGNSLSDFSNPVIVSLRINDF